MYLNIVNTKIKKKSVHFNHLTGEILLHMSVQQNLENSKPYENVCSSQTRIRPWYSKISFCHIAAFWLANGRVLIVNTTLIRVNRVRSFVARSFAYDLKAWIEN